MVVDLHPPATELAQPPEPSTRSPFDGLSVAVVVLGVVVNVLVVTGGRFPFAGPLLGFLFVLVAPILLLCGTRIWGRPSMAERVGYSLATTLLLLLLLGLGINSVLPHLGVSRPLDPIPVVVMVDVLNAALLIVRRRYGIPFGLAKGLSTLRGKEVALLSLSILTVPLAVMGANRLNNRAGNQVTMVMLLLVAVTFFLLLLWRGRVRHGATSAVIYFISLAMLLMTSLRGWSISGHDIQREYRVFQLTKAHGHWDISYFKSAYNACLSLTILPTELSQLIRVDDAYIYKFFFQLIFAMCPVLVYTIARRYFPKPVAILATVYFVGFPTFFIDMPYLNRQEMAFLFVCVAVLAITNPSWSRWTRRIVFIGAALGMELSHYSTTYMFLGTIAIAWVTFKIYGFWRAIRRRRAGRHGKSPDVDLERADNPSAFNFLCIAAVVVFVLGWGVFATHTAQGVAGQAKSSVTGFFEKTSGTQSSSVSYSLLSGSSAAGSPQQALAREREQILAIRAHAPAGTFEPLSTVDKYPTPVATPPDLPTSSAGKLVSKVVSVSTVNSVIRSLAAKGEQFFVLIGLISLFFVRRFRRRVGRAYVFLCIGSIGMVALITLLPYLSAEYGLLRAFQESLIFTAPVLVVGSLMLFRPLGERVSFALATAVCFVFFISTTGLLPQALGGYPAQLNLDNSGSYYNTYFVHPQELEAVAWLAGKPGVLPDGIQADANSDRFNFTSLNDVVGDQVILDNFPALVERRSWVILSYANLHADTATTTYNSDLIAYKYPRAFLSATKNLVFNNGGTEIFK